jgi:hypothetical protein
MIDAAKVYRDGKGEWTTLDVQLYYSQPYLLSEAKRCVRGRRTAFVLREDAEAVLLAARGSSGESK